MEYSRRREGKEQEVSDVQQNRTLKKPRIVIVVSKQFVGLYHYLRLIKSQTPPNVVPIAITTTLPLKEPMDPWFYWVEHGSPQAISLEKFYSIHLEDGEYFYVCRATIFSVLKSECIGLIGMTEVGLQRFLVAYERTNKVTTLDKLVNPDGDIIDFEYSTIMINPADGRQMERDLASELNIVDPWELTKNLCLLAGRCASGTLYPPPHQSGTRRAITPGACIPIVGEGKIRGTR